MCSVRLTLLLSVLADTIEGPSEERLIMDIFEKYNKYSRPVRNENESLEVNFGLTLQSIIEVVRRRRSAPARPEVRRRKLPEAAGMLPRVPGADPRGPWGDLPSDLQKILHQDLSQPIPGQFLWLGRPPLTWPASPTKSGIRPVSVHVH